MKIKTILSILGLASSVACTNASFLQPTNKQPIKTEYCVSPCRVWSIKVLNESNQALKALISLDGGENRHTDMTGTVNAMITDETRLRTIRVSVIGYTDIVVALAYPLTDQIIVMKK